MSASLHQLFPEAVAAPLGDFDTLWKHWPRKEGKPLAKAKYEAILKGGFVTKTLDKDSGSYVEIELSATPEEILAGAKAYLETQFDRNTYRYRENARFVMHLSTFLNRGGWTGYV